MDMLLNVGFDDDELQGMFDDVDVSDDDFDIEKAVKETTVPKVKLGEIWELGDHKLLVGSSTDETAVRLLMGKDTADIVYCDPPYNIGLDYSKGLGKSEKYGGSYSGKDDSKNFFFCRDNYRSFSFNGFLFYKFVIKQQPQFLH